MEAINSILDTAKERVKNPFFATLILVWLFRNWQVVFAVFNFDEGFELNEKVNYIKAYYEYKCFWGIFLNNILLALALMVSSYIFIVLTRVIVNIADHNLTPFLNRKTVSKLVVNSDKYESVKKQRNDFFKSLEDANESIINLEQKNSLLRNEIVAVELNVKGRDEELKIARDENKGLIAGSQRTGVEMQKANDKLHLMQKSLDAHKSSLNFLENSVERLQDDKKVIYDIFYADFNEYENMFESEKILMEKKIPSTVYTFYSLMADKHLESDFFDIASYLNNSSGKQHLAVAIDTIKQLVHLNFLHLIDTSEGYTLGNLELSELGSIILKFRELLRNRYNRENLPF